MMTKTLGALCAIALLLGCANAKQSTPALWKVSDADNSVYLLGSFHFLKADDYPLSAQTEAALADAENLLFEVAPQEMLSPELSMAMLKAGIRTDATQLNSELSPELQNKLGAWIENNQAELAKIGVDSASMQRFEPWYAGMLISLIELQKNGLQPALGLDKHFIERAQKSGKPSAGLELGSQQIALFDTMSKPQQLDFLAESLQESQTASLELQRMHAAWRRGDVKYMWKEMALPMREKYPALYRQINTARNDAWLIQLNTRLNNPGTDDSLVVVGALHLLGEDGLVEKLRSKGYRVERLQ